VTDRTADVASARAGDPVVPGDSPYPDRGPAIDYPAIARSVEYQELRRRRRTLAVTGSVLFVVPYMAFVLASVLVPHMMGTAVLGAVTLGFLVGFVVIAWTLVLIRWYRFRSARDIDPLVDALRDRWEGPR
jgi:uncharacterized membrane protein (DUF485 family)